jgi:hypothetical protein
VNLHKQTLLQETTMSLSAVEQTKQPYSIEKKQMPARFNSEKQMKTSRKSLRTISLLLTIEDLMENLLNPLIKKFSHLHFSNCDINKPFDL